MSDKVRDAIAKREAARKPKPEPKRAPKPVEPEITETLAVETPTE